jgi:hypothetical protein
MRGSIAAARCSRQQSPMKRMSKAGGVPDSARIAWITNLLQR